MDQAKAVLKTTARYLLVGLAEALTLLATGAVWLAEQAKRLARKLGDDE